MDTPERHKTIQQAATLTGFSVHTLRYYEESGLIVDIARSESGHRLYTDEDIHWIKVLGYLRETGMPLATMRKYATAHRKGVRAAHELRGLIEGHMNQLLDRVNQLNRFRELSEAKVAMLRHFEACPDEARFAEWRRECTRELIAVTDGIRQPGSMNSDQNRVEAEGE